MIDEFENLHDPNRSDEGQLSGAIFKAGLEHRSLKGGKPLDLDVSFSKKSALHASSSNGERRNHGHSARRRCYRPERVSDSEALDYTQLDRDVRKIFYKATQGADLPTSVVASLQREHSTRDLASIAKYLTSEQRINVFKSLQLLAADSNSLNYIEGKIALVLNASTVTEKIKIAEELLSKGAKGHNLTSLVTVLRSSKDIHELNEVMESLGYGNLQKVRSIRVLDLIAQVKIGQALRDLELPDEPHYNSNRVTILHCLSAIESRLKKAQRIIKADSILVRSHTATDFLDIVKEDLKLLRQARREAESVGELRELAYTLLEKIPLEFQYKVSIKNSTNPDQIAQPWTRDEISDLAQVLNLFNEGKILFNGMLKEICKVSVCQGEEDSNDDVHGKWGQNGIIELNPRSIASDIIESNYENVSALQCVLAHELGHMLQLGSRAYVYHGPKSGVVLGPTLPISDFDEYLRISGWSIIDSSLYQLIHDKQAIILDGDTYRLDDHPVDFKGTSIFLSYKEDLGVLLAYRSNAQFSLHRYSKTDPWEDYAEAFSEYMLLPERLIKFAPKKFKFFEQEYGRYSEDLIIMDRLDQALSKQIASYTRSTLHQKDYQLGAVPKTLQGIPSLDINYGRSVNRVKDELFYFNNPRLENFLNERFLRMTSGEQSWILANLISKTEGRRGGTGVYDLYGHLKKCRREVREISFRRYINDPYGREDIADLFLDIFRTYHPAHLSAFIAVVKGEEIGLLTGRSSRDGNTAVIAAAERYFGTPLSIQNIYFVNDPVLNQRIRHLPDTASKKVEIVKNFVTSSYTSPEGDEKRMPKEYERVIVYDDERKNLSAFRDFQAITRCSEKLRIVDVQRLNHESLWSSVLHRLCRGEVDQSKPRSIIHLFDIDGTLLTTNAHYKVIDKRTGDIKRSISQSEWADHPTHEYWLDLLARACPELREEDLTIDFSDIVDPERVKASLVEPAIYRLPNYHEIRAGNRVARTANR